MEPAVRVTRPQSGITPTASHISNYAWPEQSQLRLRTRSESVPEPEARNGIFGCGGRARNVPLKHATVRGRPKSGNWVAESPLRNDLFGFARDGRDSRARTTDPPPSHRAGLPLSGNGNFRCRDRRAKSGFSPAGDGYRDYQKRAKAPIPRGKCEDNHRSSIPEDWVVEVVGLELETHHAVIEPVSACAGNGNFRCRDGGSKIRLFPRRETDTETTRSGQKPPFGAENAKTPTQVRYLETGWWAHQGSNLGSDD
jgi:hypothetical protein